MKIKLGTLKLLIREAMGADTLEPGDIVYVAMLGSMMKIRVVRIEPRLDNKKITPGFLGRQEDGTELWFSMTEMLAGSKRKYYLT